MTCPSTPDSRPKAQKKSSKKKMSKYEQMIQSAMQCDRSEDEVNDNHINKIKQSTGGGDFKKIDKI